jgi:hypothetical protein
MSYNMRNKSGMGNCAREPLAFSQRNPGGSLFLRTILWQSFAGTVVYGHRDKSDGLYGSLNIVRTQLTTCLHPFNFMHHFLFAFGSMLLLFASLTRSLH